MVTEHQRKSVSAEVNYGIRFSSSTEAEDFLKRLSGEVADRLSGLGLRGRSVTLKLLMRSADAPKETAKFLGHGVCDAASRSLLLPASVSDGPAIAEAVLKLHAQMGVAAEDMRGVGIQVSKLDAPTKSGTLQSFLAKKSQNKVIEKKVSEPMQKAETVGIVKDENEEKTIAEVSRLRGKKEPEAGSSRIHLSSPQKRIKGKSPASLTSKQQSSLFKPQTEASPRPQLPPIAELDPEVISALPEDIRLELLAQYGASSLPGLPHLPDTTDQTSSDSWTVPPPDLTDSNSRDSTASLPGSNLFAGLQPRELRTLIASWVEAESEPQSCDVAMLAAHAAGWAAERRLEALDVSLRCLWRCIRTHRAGIAQWEDAYREVVQNVQHAMVQVYKYPLRVLQL